MAFGVFGHHPSRETREAIAAPVKPLSTLMLWGGVSGRGADYHGWGPGSEKPATSIPGGRLTKKAPLIHPANPSRLSASATSARPGTGMPAGN